MVRDADKVTPVESELQSTSTGTDEALLKVVRERLAVMKEAELSEPGTGLSGRELASLSLKKYGVGASCLCVEAPRSWLTAFCICSA